MFSIFEISLFKIIINLVFLIKFKKYIKNIIINLLEGYYFFFKIMALVMIINLLSILPYSLSLTSLTTNILISIILWLRILLYYIIFNNTNNISHFLPQRAPFIIIYALVIIETISVIIRPLSLRVRLISNITSRHLIIHLLTEVSVLGLVFLILFEFFVCIIQSYIFFLLLNIYLNEIKSF